MSPRWKWFARLELFSSWRDDADICAEEIDAGLGPLTRLCGSPAI